MKKVPKKKTARKKTTRKKAVSPIRLDVRDDGIAVLTFDRPNSPANIFDEATLDALDSRIDEISELPIATGVILLSAKDSRYCRQLGKPMASSFLVDTAK